MITIDQMIQREVCCCLSSLVSTLAGGINVMMHGGSTPKRTDLVDLIEQAMELAAPIPDYEDAARQEGWETINGQFMRSTGDALAPWDTNDTDISEACAWENLCSDLGIDPYDREVFEHWSVSNWLAEKLIAQGEKVDTDFAAMNVWARTTTGQHLSADSVIEKIYADMIR